MLLASAACRWRRTRRSTLSPPLRPPPLRPAHRRAIIALARHHHCPAADRGDAHAERTHRRREPARPPRGARARAHHPLVPQPLAVSVRPCGSSSTAPGAGRGPRLRARRRPRTASPTSPTRATCSGTCSRTRCSSSDRDGRSRSARRTRSTVTESCGCPTCRSRPGGRRARHLRAERGAPASDADGDGPRLPAPGVSRRRARPAPAASDDDPFKLGLTLYSASAEFRAGWFDFDGLLDRVAELGIGPGIEIVASQVLPTYPVVSDEFVERPGARRSTGTGSTRARSEPTSTWAVGATAT